VTEAQQERLGHPSWGIEMSSRLLVLAWETRGLKPSTRLVFLTLADYCDREGRNAFPSTQTIARDTEVSVRTVQHALGDLLGLGLIAIDVPATPKKPTTYRLFPRGAGFAPLKADRGETVAPGGAQKTTARGANSDAASLDPLVDPGTYTPSDQKRQKKQIASVDPPKPGTVYAGGHVPKPKKPDPRHRDHVFCGDYFCVTREKHDRYALRAVTAGLAPAELDLGKFYEDAHGDIATSGTTDHPALWLEKRFTEALKEEATA